MIIKDNIKKFCPVRVVKYHKHKYKKTKWITKGIIKSIKFRDNLYKKLKQTSPDSQNFNMLKINLRTYNKILKRSIKLAKTDYYQFSLTKYKNDIQGTWQRYLLYSKKAAEKRLAIIGQLVLLLSCAKLWRAV